MKHVPDFIKRVKSGDGGRLMGFGHRVYKNYDPRAKIIKTGRRRGLRSHGKNPLLDIALELERIALEDEYFVKRKLYPNVDFYSGLIYQAMRFPTSMFTVLFAIPRVSGWLAQWQEMLDDPDQKIARPRQIYTGARGATIRAVERPPPPTTRPFAPLRALTGASPCARRAADDVIALDDEDAAEDQMSATCCASRPTAPRCRREAGR